MTTGQRTSIEGRSLLLFDGLCGMCHGTIRFLIRNDPSRNLLYAPLESPIGQEMLEATQSNADGIVLIEAALTSRQVVTTRSDAAIRVLNLLHGAWPFAGWLLARIPRWLRESAYQWIARARYRLFGAYQACPLPAPAERDMILGIADRGCANHPC